MKLHACSCGSKLRWTWSRKLGQRERNESDVFHRWRR